MTEPFVVPQIVTELGKAVVLQNLNPIKIQAEQLQFILGDVIQELNVQLGGAAQRAPQPASTLHCFFGLYVTGRTAAPESRPVAFVAATLGLAYQVTDADLFARVSDEDIQAFASINGIRHAWPYFRELCQSLTVRLAVTPIILPTLPPGLAVDFSQGQPFEWPKATNVGVEPSP